MELLKKKKSGNMYFICKLIFNAFYMAEQKVKCANLKGRNNTRYFLFRIIHALAFQREITSSIFINRVSIKVSFSISLQFVIVRYTTTCI